MENNYQPDQWYKHPSWQRVRAEIMIRDNWTCRACGATEKDGRQFVVHHLKYTMLPQWREPPENLITLCHACHNKKHDNFLPIEDPPEDDVGRLKEEPKKEPEPLTPLQPNPPRLVRRLTRAQGYPKQHSKWSDTDRELLNELYLTKTDEELERLFGRGIYAIRRQAQSQGISVRPLPKPSQQTSPPTEQPQETPSVETIEETTRRIIREELAAILEGRGGHQRQ